jgi:hypothetical protein
VCTRVEIPGWFAILDIDGGFPIQSIGRREYHVSVKIDAPDVWLMRELLMRQSRKPLLVLESRTIPFPVQSSSTQVSRFAGDIDRGGLGQAFDDRHAKVASGGEDINGVVGDVGDVADFPRSTCRIGYAESDMGGNVGGIAGLEMGTDGPRE